MEILIVIAVVAFTTIVKGTYTVTVSGNWRITFAFRQGSAHNVNLEDYH